MATTTNKKVLIVEDDKPMAFALELKLKHEGINAKAVLGGKEAIDMLKKESYNLVLCDLIMPDVDGFMVLETLKKENIKVPVIILSNLSQAEDERRARELGAIDFFVKSNTPIKTIVDKITEFIS